MVILKESIKNINNIRSIESINKISEEIIILKRQIKMNINLDKNINNINIFMKNNEKSFYELKNFSDINKRNEYFEYNKDVVKHIHDIVINEKEIFSRLKERKFQNKDLYEEYINDNENEFIECYKYSIEDLKEYKEYLLSFLNNELKQYNIEIIEHNQLYYDKNDIRSKALYDHLCIKVEKDNEVMVFPLTSDNFLFLKRLVDIEYIDFGITKNLIDTFIKTEIENVKLFKSQYTSKFSYNYSKLRMEEIKEAFFLKKEILPLDEQLILDSEISSKCVMTVNNMSSNVKSIKKETLTELVENGTSYENIITEKINELPINESETIKDTIIKVFSVVFSLFS